MLVILLLAQMCHFIQSHSLKPINHCQINVNIICIFVEVAQAKGLPENAVPDTHHVRFKASYDGTADNADRDEVLTA